MATSTFSKRLKQAMDAAGVKQADLVRLAAERGEKLGKSQVSQYVSGKVAPRKDVLALLASLLRVDSAWLAGESSEGGPAAAAESGPLAAGAAGAENGPLAAGAEGVAVEGPSAQAPSPESSSAANREAPSAASGSDAVTPSVNGGVTAGSGDPARASERPRAATSIDYIAGQQANTPGSSFMREFKKSSKLDNVLYDVRGPVVDEAARMEAEGERILKLNIGNPAPFGFRTPDEVVKDMRQQLTECEGYSDSRGLFSARKAIMQYAQVKNLPNVEMENIYTGNGVSELIQLCMHALLDDGDEVLIPSPDYPLWTACTTLAGGHPVHYLCDEQADWNPDIADMESKVTSRTKAIVVINPNNPTGAVYSREVLQEIVEVARRHQLMIFADEIYDRLCMDGVEHVSIASLAPDLPCVTFSGLSKSHMIAGFRIGWMILSGNTRCMKDFMFGVHMLSNMRLCSNVPAQSIVQTALGGYQSVNTYVRPGGRVYEQRDFVWKALNEIDGITAVKPKAAFYIFPKIDVEKFNIHDDEQFALDLLHQKKILITRGGGFNWDKPDHFRIVYLPRIEVLAECMDDLADFLSTYRQD